jgi:thiosulfate/3-mercaptopyruvate sulfurtransferase
MSDYAQPDVLVSTDWVKARLGEPGLRIIEIDVDTQAYAAGHVPGAVGFNWQTQLQDGVRRDILSQAEFERLLGEAGVSPDDTVILYGDNNNWFAAYGFWLMKIYGHRDVRLMNGGRKKWLDEADKEMTPAVPAVRPTVYRAKPANPALRARLADIFAVLERRDHNLVDVRSGDEFTGKIIAPPGLSETAQRAGHGTFKRADELRSIYLNGAGDVDPARPTIAYCRIGERSSHTWFVLTYLLGLERVRNYDGSWTEYGNLIGVPIER